MKREPVPARLEDGVVLSAAIAIAVASSSSASSTPQLATSASRAASSKEQLAEPAVHVHGLPTARGGVAREAIGARSPVDKALPRAVAREAVGARPLS